MSQVIFQIEYRVKIYTGKWSNMTLRQKNYLVSLCGNKSNNVMLKKKGADNHCVIKSSQQCLVATSPKRVASSKQG